MEFRIAATFTAALARLAATEQKAVKTTAFDLQMDPAAPGLKFHRIERSRDPHFWSVRASGDLRIIVHKTDAGFLLAYVGHHDDFCSLAERRRIEAHPATGAIQIVEVRERVEEFVTPSAPAEPAPAAPVMPFRRLSAEDLLAVGVPQDWVADVQQATEDAFLNLAGHPPAEAAEALLEYVGTGRLPRLRRSSLRPTRSPTPTRCAASAWWRTKLRWRSRWTRRGNAGRCSCIPRSRASLIAATMARRAPPVRPAPAKRWWHCIAPRASLSRRPTAACC